MIDMTPGYTGASTARHPSVITGRSGNVLAGFHGFGSVEALAESIPENTDVLDVGAGFSTLGHDVATLRTDIRWTNFDVIYGWDGENRYIEERLIELALAAPDNLTYQEGDILSPPGELIGKGFSRIFSFFMLPYVMRRDESRGFAAVINMLEMGEPGGLVSIGPTFGREGPATQAITVPDNMEDVGKLAVEFVDAVANANQSQLFHA